MMKFIENVMSFKIHKNGQNRYRVKEKMDENDPNRKRASKSKEKSNST